MTLEILVCTIDHGIDNVTELVLPPREGISYLVSWQHSTPEAIETPAALLRDDVRIVDLPGRGLSRNRNNCLRHATGDLCLIADDDCRYTNERLQAIIDTMRDNPDVDFASFREESVDTKNVYPEYSFDLRQCPKNYFIASIDIVFHRERVQGRLWFNELFGYGAPLACGEEEILLLDALKLGLSCRYFPIDIVKHVGLSNVIVNVGKRNTLMGRGAYMAVAKPWTCVPRIFLNSWRLWRTYNVPFWHSVSCMTAGVVYYLRHK